MTDLRNVVEIIDQSKVSWLQRRVVLLGILIVCLDGFDNQSIAFVAPALKTAWHLQRGALGPVFSAGVMGLGLGGLLIGPFADRFGRTRTLIATVTFSAVMTTLIAQVTTLSELLALRFFIGLGLGAVMPLCIVLANEYSPHRHRGALVTLVTTGYSIGAATGGFVTAHLVPLWGWQSVFYVGGGMTLVVALGLRFCMPESIRFLALKSDGTPRIIKILRQINPALTFGSDVRFTIASGTEVPDHASPIGKLRELFAQNRRFVTILLWFSLFMDLIVLNFLINWLPSLVTDMGLPGPLALKVSTALQFGGFIGVISMGILADRFGYYRVIALSFAVGGLSIASIGLVGTSLVGLIGTIFVAGVGSIGCNLILGALSATLYPIRIRATGSSWAFGVARLLSIASPLLGGFVISLRWSLQDIFITVSVPMFLGSLSIFTMATIAKTRLSPVAVRPANDGKTA